MTDDAERIQRAQWVLERNLHWISAAEVKTGFVVALDTAMLGALAAVVGTVTLGDQSAWGLLLAVTGAVCLAASLLCSAMSVLPRTDGPPQSLVFFGKVASRDAPDYASDFLHTSPREYLRDLLDQIHRNAEIASEKFGWVRSAIMWSFLSVLPWTGAIVCLRVI